MKEQENIGFVKWLENQGVKRITEQQVVVKGEKIPDTKNSNAILVFDSYGDFNTFIDRNYITGKFKTKTLGYELHIILTAKEKNELKTAYSKEYPSIKTEEEIDKHLELIRSTKDKILEFNKFSERELKEKNSDAEVDYEAQMSNKAIDKIGMMAKMLRNHSPGWFVNKAMIATDLAQNIYYALNYDYLSKDDKDKMQNVIDLFRKDNKFSPFQGEIAFFIYYFPFYSNYLNPKDIISDNIESLLHGGYRKIPNSENILSLSAKKNTPRSYYQPRFLPDEHGKSETDIIIIHAAGSTAHTAFRVLKKEADANTPGGFKYYYTKVNAGGRLEIGTIDENQVIYGIYTTAIEPAYKRNILGIYTELTSQEKREMHNDPKKYQQYMQDTLQHLLEAERYIQFYSDPRKLKKVGTNKIRAEFETMQWNKYNNIINTARGKMVQERCHQTFKQQSGNCAVYSFMLLISNFVGVNLGYNMIQDVKGYNHHNVLLELNKLEQQLLNIKNEKVASTDESEIKQALKNKELYKKQDPILYAIENNINIDNMHPLIWAMTYNSTAVDDKKILIEGQSPLLWATRQQNLLIEDKPILKYLQLYGIQKKSSLIKEMKENNIDLLSFFVAEYFTLKNKKPVNKVEIEELEKFYNKIEVKFVGQGFAKELGKSDFIALLKNHSAKELAMLFATPAFASSFHNPTGDLEKNLRVEHILYSLPLDIIYKFIETGKEIAEAEKNNLEKVNNFKNKLNKILSDPNNGDNYRYREFIFKYAESAHIPKISSTIDSNITEKLDYIKKVLDKINTPENIIER